MRLYIAENLPEARMILDLLEEAGIRAEIKNELLVGAFGELPYSESRPQIWIRDAIQFDAARALVAEYEARRRAPEGPPKTCPSCGEENPSNFELCWSCRAEI